MFEIGCEECNQVLQIDYSDTLSEYLNKVDYMEDTIDSICGKAIHSYLMYKCVGCGKKFKYTIQDVELKIRQNITKDIKSYRKIQVFNNLDPTKIVDPDNGMEFCGICDGVDGEGNCFLDIISQCPFRR